MFFEHLANRRFPTGAFIRSEAEMDYLEESAAETPLEATGEANRSLQ